MNLYSTVPTLNSFEGDPVERLGRKTFLQFVALDYCIYRQLEIIIRYLNNQRLQKQLVENPYKITSELVKELTNKNKTNRNGKGIGAVIQAFKHYNISMCLQQILSYVLINTIRVVELQKVEVKDIDGTSESYATLDTIDNDVLKYYRDLRDSKVKEELESANSGIPMVGSYEDIILSIIQSLGDFSNEDIENILQENKNIIPEERERERTLINNIFKKSDTGDLPIPYWDIEKNAGFHNVFDRFSNFLPNDIQGIVNSSLFFSLIGYWGKLFSEAQPEIINALVAKLPSIKEKFFTSNTTSTTQQEYRYQSLKTLSEFLDKAIKPIRINQLSNVSRNPSAANCLVILRSLRVLEWDKSDIYYINYYKIVDALETFKDNANKILRTNTPNASNNGNPIDRVLSLLDDFNAMTTDLEKLKKNHKFYIDHTENITELDEILKSGIELRETNTDDKEKVQKFVDKIDIERYAIPEGNQFDIKNDRTGRLGFLYVCLWLLSKDKELSDLFKFVLNNTTVPEEDNVSEENKLEKKVNPESMFPGSFDYGKESRTGSASLIDLDMENDRRKVSIKEDNLKRAGDLEKVMESDGVKWLI